MVKTMMSDSKSLSFRVCLPFMFAQWRTQKNVKCCCTETWPMPEPLCLIPVMATCTGLCGISPPGGGSCPTPPAKVSLNVPGWMAHTGNPLLPPNSSGPTASLLTSRKVFCTGVTATTVWLEECVWMVLGMKWVVHFIVSISFIKSLTRP